MVKSPRRVLFWGHGVKLNITKKVFEKIPRQKKSSFFLKVSAELYLDMTHIIWLIWLIWLISWPEFRSIWRNNMFTCSILVVVQLKTADDKKSFETTNLDNGQPMQLHHLKFIGRRKKAEVVEAKAIYLIYFLFCFRHLMNLFCVSIPFSFNKFCSNFFNFFFFRE